MSKGTLGQVVKRAISDAAFRRQLQSDPEGALKGFDLTSDERAALRSGDASKLSGFGVDQRMSKAFALGESASAVSARGHGGTDLSNSESARAAFIDQDSSSGNARAALIDQDSSSGNARAALIDQQSADGSGARAGLIDQGAGGRAALTDSDRLGQVNAAFEGSDSAAGGRALGDQHDGGRAAIGGTQDYGQQTSLDVSGATRGTSAISGDTAGGREGTAYITADEAGRDSSPAAAMASDSSANTAFMTSDEMGSGVTAYTGDDTASDALPTDTGVDPWAENPEHQG
jgi:hypothetical protein